jgi:hypothetical protein
MGRAWITLVLLLAGCSGDGSSGVDAGADAGADTDSDADSDGDSDAGEDAGSDAGQEPAMETVTFTELAGEAPGPERGFFSYIDLLDDSDDLSWVVDEGHTLAYAGVRLDAWADADLPASLLADLGAGFGRVRDAGLEVVLRFDYNDGPTGAPDASLARIEGHLAQLSPVLADNADVIALLQAGFIGTWGEWHDSTNGLDTTANRAAVLAAVLDALPQDRMTAVRTPEFKEEIFPGGPLTEATAFTGDDAARVGQHNDCFLASDDDEGTYPDPIEDWKDYVAEEGRFTPVGGETCAANPPRSECASALLELERLHFTYLNAGYHPDVLASWESGGCMDEIRERLGYRFVVHEASHSASARPGGIVHLVVTLGNEGYAAPFNARPLVAVLSSGAQRWVATLAGEDVRRWEPGQPIVLDLRLGLPSDLAPGGYALGLALPDAAATLAGRPEYAVRFASEAVWDGARGVNVLVPALSVAADGGSALGPETAAFVAR